MNLENRPDPQDLLRQIQEESLNQSRGRLKIFFGYAAGVGKTYAMLEAAHQAQQEGVEVLVGYVERHTRPETLALLEGLRELPSALITYKGIQLREFDLDKALERKPELILVDELAHTNAAGSRHAKRYQDIEELLEAGIHVYTTVNVQHVESLNDMVGSITGITVRERIPDHVFQDADQVKLVDIEPDDLLLRLREGKVYKEGQARRAMENFFTKDKLIALREVALRCMADRINRISEQARSRDASYYTGEHILCCVSPAPGSKRVIRSAARLAGVFHANMTAIYVENEQFVKQSEEQKHMLEENLQLARMLGAKVVLDYGEETAHKIAEYAKVSNVSKIVMGRTKHRPLTGFGGGTLSEKLIEEVPQLEVYIIPDKGEQKEKRRFYPFAPENVTMNDLCKMCGILAVAVIIGEIFLTFGLAQDNIISIFLLAQMLVGILTRGRIYGLLSSIGGVLLYNFFFTNPIWTFQAYDKSYPVTFATLFIASLIISSLSDRLRKETRAAARKAYRMEILLENSRRLRRAGTVKQIADTVCGRVVQLTGLSVTFYEKVKKEILPPLIYPREGMTMEEMEEYIALDEQSVALWAAQKGHRAGACTETLSHSKCLYIPVKNEERVFAVIGIVLEERRALNSFEYDILMGLVNDTALVMEKHDVLDKLKERASGK